MLKVTVAYASADRQLELTLAVEPDVTVIRAIKRSGILAEFAEIDITQAEVGINSRKVALDAGLSDGDRIEIYRPLIIDPKAARMLRAKRKK